MNLSEEIEWWASEVASQETEVDRLLRAMALRIKELEKFDRIAERNKRAEEPIKYACTDAHLAFIKGAGK